MSWEGLWSRSRREMSGRDIERNEEVKTVKEMKGD